jgi:hypothetical protein
MRPGFATVAPLLLLFPLGGCCSISQGLSALFCGPREPLPRRACLTPNQTLKTLLAAISCDDSRTIFKALGPDFKHRSHIGGLEWEIAWQQIKKETPGIHLAYEAEPRDPKPTVQAPTPARPFPLASFTLTLPGTTIEVRLRKYAYWKIVFQTSDMKNPDEVSQHIRHPDKAVLWAFDIRQVSKLKWVDPNTRVELSLPGLPWQGVGITEILSAGAGIEWLVYDFRIVQ